MTRAELRTRLLDAGFTFLTTTQANDFIDQAARELTIADLWRYRSTIVTGAAPLTVTDLGSVDSVHQSNRPLMELRKADLVARGFDLTLAGPGVFYYEEGTAVKSWPVATSITVDHYTLKAWTTGTQQAGSDADTPLAPLRFHDVIDYMARRHAKAFNDDFDEAVAISGFIDLRLNELRRTELARPASPAKNPEAQLAVARDAR